MKDISSSKREKAHKDDISSELRQLVFKKARELGEESGVYLCRIDNDCLPGFICVKGLCVPAESKQPAF